MLFVIPLQAQDFITTWETATASEMITIPTAPGETYLYDVDWENDGTFDDIGVTGDATHTYPTAGVHVVAIRGVFPQIFFNNSGDTDKIIIVNNMAERKKLLFKKGDAFIALPGGAGTIEEITEIISWFNFIDVFI